MSNLNYEYKKNNDITDKNNRINDYLKSFNPDIEQDSFKTKLIERILLLKYKELLDYSSFPIERQQLNNCSIAQLKIIKKHYEEQFNNKPHSR